MHPDINFRQAETYYWSPIDRTVCYKKDDKSRHGIWSLMHEVGHGVLGHTKYYSDFELVRMEMGAWEKAKELAREMHEQGAMSEELCERQDPNSTTAIASPPLNTHRSILTISEDHIQDCLDSYRDWLHKRSLCPDCNLSSIQIDTHTYMCVFCHKKWHVTAERFCRPYRRKF